MYASPTMAFPSSDPEQVQRKVHLLQPYRDRCGLPSVQRFSIQS